MDERLMQFRIGVMVLASIMIAAILVVTFGEWRWPFPSEYTIYIKFAEAPGVAERTPLRKSGIVIGRVTDVKLTPEGEVLVTARIERQYLLRRNEVCRLNRAILGDSMLEFSRSSDPDAPSDPVREGDVMQGIVPPDPVVVFTNLQERLVMAIDSVTTTSNELGRTVRAVSSVIDDNRQAVADLVRNANETVVEARSTVKNANDLVGDPELKARLKEALDRIPTLVDDIRATLNETNQTIAAARGNLENLRSFTDSLSERGPVIVQRLDGSLQKLDQLMAELETFGQNLNQEDGTLGRLIRDPELYEKLDRTMGNVQQLTQDLRPIISDMRVFSDKIARHPELLGVRGALERNAGTKGVPQIPGTTENDARILPGLFR